jgi:hypothetical protein
LTTEESFTILDVAMIPIQEQNDGQIKDLIPIGVESLLDYGRCVRLFRVDGDDCEWVGKSEDIESSHRQKQLGRVCPLFDGFQLNEVKKDN